MIAKLYENRKIANATHNMYAYRISQSKGKFDIYIIVYYFRNLQLMYVLNITMLKIWLLLYWKIPPERGMEIHLKF